LAKKSKTDLLYKAQTIGNIEPIEYMIPYPNTQSLIEGQTIKFGEQIIYKDYGISNMDLYKKIKQTANWLTSQRIKPKDNVIIEKLDFPQSELILLGLWQLGARGVILENEDLSIDKRLSAKKLKIEKSFFEEIASYSSAFYT
jgi:Acyl-CoA synthetases (AMP-forming)/AMP-acid ligases II